MNVSASNGFSRFKSDCDFEEFSRDLFESVWMTFSSTIDDNWADSLEVPISTEIAMQKLHAIVNLATFGHDGVVLSGGPLEHIDAEVEPTPTPIDNWARGAVPIRHVAPVEDVMFKADIHSDGTRTPSVSSFRSSTTGSSKTSSRSGTHRNISRGAMKSDFHDTAPKIIELDEYTPGHGDPGNASGTGHMYEMLQRANNRMKKQANTDDDVEDEFASLEAEVKKAAADLKGKKYAFDHNGRPIVINTVKPESLPPYTYQPGLNVNFDPAGNDSNHKKATKKGKKKIRVAGSRSIDQPQFVPTASLATALSSHTSIPLNPGVTLKSGESLREGPVRSDDPKKPSRKDFFSRQSLSSATGSLELGGDSVSWNDKSQSVSDGKTLGDTSSKSRSGTAVSSSSRTGDRPGGFPSKQRFQDIDPLEGGRQFTPQASQVTVEQEGGADEDYQQSQHHSGPGSQIRGTVQQPVKPSEKQRENVGLLHGGSELAGPRDRLSHQALESRRKISFAPNTGRGSKNLDSPSGSNLKQNSFASNGSSRSYGGSVKKERADIASEIF